MQAKSEKVDLDLVEALIKWGSYELNFQVRILVKVSVVALHRSAGVNSCVNWRNICRWIHCMGRHLMQFVLYCLLLT